jgi:hypothetical protein
MAVSKIAVRARTHTHNTHTHKCVYVFVCKNVCLTSCNYVDYYLSRGCAALLEPWLPLLRTRVLPCRLAAVIISLTLSLLMSYIYGAPCKVRNFNVIYIYVYMDLSLAGLKAVSFYLLHWNNAENYPVALLFVNTLPATKVNLTTDGI